jgi:vancomycin resistance protein YoaR
VPPGEEFSFNRWVGDVTAANGFTDALVIAGDRTAVGIGGGVCQVSTTAYRAAFWGGFPITERHAHGYVVGWYGEPGMDATIYTPSVDFRFRNDTGHFLLIKSEVDTVKGRMTFRFYGTKPDRTVEMVKGPITNVQPAPPPLYEEDKTLAIGVIKQVDWAQRGLDVVVTRVIHYGDGTTREENIVSKYQPWRAIYQYGPGTELPPEANAAPAGQ